MSKLAIFDCDGTLVDSGGTIHRALRSTFDSHGLACPPRGVTKKVIGLSLEEAFAALVPEGDHAALSQTYKDAFFAMRSQGVVEEPLFVGIIEALEAFRAGGWKLGVATGKSARGLKHCLAAHGITGHFATLQTADDHPSKPHPSMVLAAIGEAGCSADRTVFIGDTAWDMGSARAAACGAIGAGWGYHDESELRDAGAHDVAQDPAELVRLSERWIGEQA